MSPIPTPQEVAERFERRWGEGDLDGALALVSQTCVYRLSFSGAGGGHASELAGREAMRNSFRKFPADLRPLPLPTFGPRGRGIAGPHARRVHVSSSCQRRGAERHLPPYLPGREWPDRGRREYQDAPFFAAFMRLFDQDPGRDPDQA